jgi:uncharacterized tellurite resistance protein B-like protein
MGLFDMFRSDKGTAMTPHKILAISMLYIMASDGEYDNEEVGQLLSVLGGEERNGVIYVGGNNSNLLDESVRYVKKNSVESFLSEVKSLNILSDAQKVYILCNMLDSSLSDGESESAEQKLFYKFMEAFGISEERLKPFFQVIYLKNDRSIFLNPNNPKNSPDYKVKLDM